jgi:(p)ppGpp synthase/HD superfamily hydrolase
MSLVELAEDVARMAHDGQVDKSGRDYIEHPARVAGIAAARGGSKAVVAAAWMHDVLEDTFVKEHELEFLGFPRNVIDAVVAVTRTPEVPPEDYYANIRTNPDALAVKLADIADNLDEDRLALLDEKTAARLRRKYAKAIHLLTGDV